MNKPRLTIGMACFDDYEGVYFTLQSLRMHHKPIIEQCEIIVVDNNPDSDHGKCVKKTCADFGWYADGREVVRYIPYTEKVSTSVRNEVFNNATADYVLCIDCHVMLANGALEKLIEYFEVTDTDNLIHGVMVHENNTTCAIGLNDVWGVHFWGQWINVERKDLPIKPFRIGAHGFGLFASKKSSWLGFNNHYKGFGGEEWLLGLRYETYGRCLMCLPYLEWSHRFTRVSGNQPYPNRWEDRIRNYIIGALEIGMDVRIITNQFTDLFTQEYMNNVIRECIKLDTTPEDIRLKYEKELG